MFLDKPGKPGVVNTIGRFFDFTIRLNLGIVSLAKRTAKDATDKKNWVRILEFYF